MARTFVWRSALPAALAFLAACGSEQLTTPGRCPDVCPAGDVLLADITLTAPDTADTSVRGYVTARESALLLASTLDSLQSVILIRFGAVSPDTFHVSADTVQLRAAAPPDSVRLLLHVIQRDSTATQRKLVIYRLPAQFDSTMTYARAQSFLVDAAVVDTVAIRDSLTGTDTLNIRMPATLVAAAADSGVIALGVKLLASTPTAIGLGSGNQGTVGPLLSYFVHAQSDTAKKRTLSVAPMFAVFVQSPDPAQTPPGVLAVGGLPAARSRMYLALPKEVVDSNSIVRATLILNTVRPAVGFPRERFYVRAQPLLRDYGAKSLVYPAASVADSTLVQEGQSGTVTLEIAAILRLWGTTSGDSLPRVVELSVAPEGGVLGQIDFKGRAAGARGAPQLRVTYVRPYRFGVP